MDDFHFGAFSEALTLVEAQRMVAAFPNGVVCPDDPFTPESTDEVRHLVVTGDPRVAALLPVKISLEHQQVGSTEQAFLDVVGSGIGSIEWTYFNWPAVPELQLEMRHKDAYVQIAINSRDIHGDEPASDHTVFIHVPHGATERAKWLARRVGLQPLGPLGPGW
ncbi:hypothetical protein [Kitasatospora sp. CB01950]|uniref:hypothetical protein n=1 Tax=Kitasatospora sp. CB01950 TaxID=1703930 RepID=UPI0011612B84|nr:hypothetical protein [Kitasatospora sp. CB01950]